MTTQQQQGQHYTATTRRKDERDNKGRFGKSRDTAHGITINIDGDSRIGDSSLYARNDDNTIIIRKKCVEKSWKNINKRKSRQDYEHGTNL
jgi:hypothetical protein